MFREIREIKVKERSLQMVDITKRIPIQIGEEEPKPIPREIGEIDITKRIRVD